MVARWGAPESDPFFRDGRLRPAALPGSAKSSSASSRRAATISIRRKPIIRPISCRRTAISPSTLTCATTSAPMPSSTWASTAISNGCRARRWRCRRPAIPRRCSGRLPHLYPFIVNDPGEGTQAKRRTSAVIIDHLTPPLTRAETYGPLKDLEALVDEYYDASGGDPRRLRLLSKQILDLVRDIGLDQDAGIASGDGEGQALEKLDAYLCDLKEMQIRDGLHVFGVVARGAAARPIWRSPWRGCRAGWARVATQSLQRAIAADAGLVNAGGFPSLVDRATWAAHGGSIRACSMGALRDPPLREVSAGRGSRPSKLPIPPR